MEKRCSCGAQLTNSNRTNTCLKCRKHSNYLSIKSKQLKKQKEKYLSTNNNQKTCIVCATLIPNKTISALCSVHLKEKNQQYQRQYKLNNRELLSKNIGIWRKSRYHQDMDFRLRTVLRSRLVSAVKKNQKAGSAVRDLGCSIEELKKYLESKWQEGMSWDNYGKCSNQWNIDHIVPLASFDLSDPEQFKKACHYSNLQPLWAVDNLRKSNKCV